MASEKTSFSLEEAYARIRRTIDSSATTASPSDTALCSAKAYSEVIPDEGLGDQKTFDHILTDITPGLNGQNLSDNYYGFVTGSVLPIAQSTDNLVTAYDQNVCVHLPAHSISTTIESRALQYLCQLLTLPAAIFTGRIFTTGATASNILGLACGREEVVAKRLRVKGLDVDTFGVSPYGLLGACRQAGIDCLQVITTMGHSSLYKAASVVGIGRSNVVDVGVVDAPWKIDFMRLEKELLKEGVASIVSISCGEVNTGRFATSTYEEMAEVRRLCDKYQAWLHVDGAFGLLAAALPQTPEFAHLRTPTSSAHFADSLTGDCHKLLNVPYDSGFFLTRSLPTLTSVFSNGAAAYLSSSATDDIPSPLNIGIENSRRFRALPVYSVLLSLGRTGISEMLARQVRLARRISKFVADHPKLQLLPVNFKVEGGDQSKFREEEVGIVVLFRARDESVNETLLEKINEGKVIYCSGSTWEGRKAVRLAVGTWRVDVERDLEIVRAVLEAAVV